MKSHQDIDRRSLHLAREIVGRIDRDPQRRGLARAIAVCSRWEREVPQQAVAEWRELLNRDWQEIRSVLLSEGEDGQRLRQSSPFCGILSPRERWRIYKEHAG